MHIVVNRADYFKAALAVLSTDGFGGLKITRLCKSLKVTSGSFYGYFGSLAGFVDEFLEDWETTQTDRIAALLSAEPDPVLRVHALKEMAADLPHDAEASIRSWGNVNEKVKAVVRRVDERRQQVIFELVEPIVGPERAHALAVIGMTMLVGLQQWHRPVARPDYDLVFNEFEDLIIASASTGVRLPK
ncbi:TetR/AcrR family transcriptional regulator [Gordonia sp. (in: high G+C Gram-positive bacteria)]|uniref:TetR/AcrR family transcriptional regulator n=1 Tax=Gordonia sp. (in: high G+C Gram-positive bacteria) TaxID=84139 RepID=UPI003F990A5B